jgi:hypothetical protein
MPVYDFSYDRFYLLHYIYSRLERHLCYGISKSSVIRIVVHTVRMSRVSVAPHACSSFNCTRPPLCPIDLACISDTVLSNISASCPKSYGVRLLIIAVPYISLYPGLVTRISQAVCISFLVFTRQSCQYPSPKRACQRSRREAFSRGPSSFSSPATPILVSLRCHMFEMEFQAL